MDPSEPRSNSNQEEYCAAVSVANARSRSTDSASSPTHRRDSRKEIQTVFVWDENVFLPTCQVTSSNTNLEESRKRRYPSFSLFYSTMADYGTPDWVNPQGTTSGAVSEANADPGVNAGTGG